MEKKRASLSLKNQGIKKKAVILYILGSLIPLLFSGYLIARYILPSISPAENLPIIILLILFLSFLGILPLSRMMSTISRIVKGSEKVAQGERLKPLEIEEDELGRLATSLNLTAERIQKDARELQSNTQALQEARYQLNKSNQDLKRVNQELERLSKAKTLFISKASHELRNPLSVIKESISQILEGVKGKVNKEQEEFLGMAYRNTNRLTLLINNLLDLSQIEAGRIEYRRTLVDISEVVKEVLDATRMQADKKRIKIINNLPANLPSLWLDKSRITQVCTNLLDNAIKFSKEGGRVIVEAREEEKDVEISIRDFGAGIKPQNIDLIFDRFRRIDSGYLPTQGLGLGLPICKEIVENHQGRIGVESKLGEGSKFIFTLPKEKNEQENSGGG
ncbi:MAG: hypothetical protein KAX20_05715 [Candidatus Omnitrophica bacterium]|nr:hypothetical protein [Candidatus Omnitrophota bacterium]